VSLLRNRSVAALLAAEVISSIGTQMTWLALPWFVLITTGSPQQMTYVIVAEIVPLAVFGFFGGLISDRLGRRRTMLVSDLARVPLMAAIPTLHAVDALPFWALLALVAATGAFIAPYLAVQRSIVPDLVGEDQTTLARTTAVFQAAQRITIFLGPPLAGVLISIIGTAQLLYVDAATYLVSFVLVGLFVRIPRHVAAKDEESPGGVLSGARFVLRDRLLRAWTVAFFLIDVAWQSLFAVLPVLVVHHYDADPRVLGWILGALGAGALVGAAAAYRLVAKHEALTLASVAFACQVTAVWGLTLPAPWEVPFVALFIGGFFMSIVNSPTLALVTLRTPRALRPHVMSIWATLMGVGAPIALIATGAALANVDPRAVLVVILAVQTGAVALFIGAALAERTALRAAATADSAAPG
jgi:MFS family permease